VGTMKKLILDLCGGTGSWSKPYQENSEYEVRIIDPLYNETDVRLFEKLNEEVYGILAAPPLYSLLFKR
jgi:hypothetical protein